MLTRIYIQNFALIDTLDIAFNKGLQVITGETGAGKSIILGALRLILGERADIKSFADSENKSIVEAEFNISENLKPFFEENDIDYESQTIIRREILPSGKSRAFINDVPVTLDILKELSEKLIDIHSQFETSNLFSEEYQFKIIDGLSNNKTTFAKYQSEYSEYQKLKKNLEQLKSQLLTGNKESDYKTFVLNELQEAELDHINWETLQKQLQMQENSGAISENLSQILSRFDQEEIGVLDALLDIRTKISRLCELSHHFSNLHQRFEESFLEIKDILFDIQNEAEKIEINPEILNELNSKINKINTLFLKHQVFNVEDLIEIRDKISGEQNGFAELEQNIEQAEKEIVEKQETLQILAKTLSDSRKIAIPIFVEKTEHLLHQLGLEKAKILVTLTKNKELNNFGNENIAILFQANSGFPLKPIQTAISGGERSRVMLAVKKIIAENAELPTLILDEIDTGVSGKIANEMGKVMHEMAANMQLIVITHLAQVAAKGDDNYKVIKQDILGKTQSNIVALNSKEKLFEIAQLLSGAKITDAALQQAEELMK